MDLLVIGLVAAASLAVVLIVAAPWRRIREEPAVPADVQARIMLGETAAEVEAELEAEAAEHPDLPAPRRLRPPAS